MSCLLPLLYLVTPCFGMKCTDICLSGFVVIGKESGVEAPPLDHKLRIGKKPLPKPSCNAQQT